MKPTSVVVLSSNSKPCSPQRSAMGTLQQMRISPKPRQKFQPLRTNLKRKALLTKSLKSSRQSSKLRKGKPALERELKARPPSARATDECQTWQVQSAQEEGKGPPPPSPRVKAKRRFASPLSLHQVSGISMGQGRGGAANGTLPSGVSQVRRRWRYCHVYR